MYYYAIYTYKFIPQNDEGDWTQGEMVKESDTTHAQDNFYKLFGKNNTVFRVQKDVSDGAKKYDCKVFGNDHRIVALRLLNEKKTHYWKQVAVPNDPMEKVERKSLTSTPPTFVIIDCRPGCNILAVKVEPDAWRNTDNVRDLMEESINRYLETFSRGFRIKLLTKMQNRDFFDYSRKRIKKEGRAVKKITIHFKTGKLDPKVEAIVKSSDYLKRLFTLIDKYSVSGDMTLNQPIGPKLIDRRRRDIENMATIIASDPLGYAMDLTFDDNVTLHCGEDVRAELPMNPEGALELFHLGRKKENTEEQEINFEGIQEVKKSRYFLEDWLDNMAEETKKMKDAETIKRKRSRASKRQAS